MLNEHEQLSQIKPNRVILKRDVFSSDLLELGIKKGKTKQNIKARPGL